MNNKVMLRILALAVMICGILMAVLSPPGETKSSWQIVGVLLLVIGTFWLIKQRGPSSAPDSTQMPQNFERKAMTLQQSPILWLPIIIALVAIAAALVN